MLTSGAFGYLFDYLFWWLACLSIVVHTWCFFRFFPRKKYRRTGLIAGNLLVLLSMLGIVALLGESYFRFVAVETDAFGMSLPARRWFAIHTRLNSLGCRDREWTAEKPPGVRRIAFVGDSFAYGWGIKRAQDRFSDRLGAMFEADRAASRGVENDRGSAAHSSVEVMNVAKAGWDSGGQVQPVRDMISVYGVDEIVLCYVPNDIEKLLPRSEDFDPIRPPEPRLLNPTSSCLVDYLFHRVCVPMAPTVRDYHDWLADGFADPSTLRRHQQQLLEMIGYAREHDVTFRVVLLPFILHGGKRYQPKKVHGLMKDFFEQQGVQVVDLLATIADRDPAELVVNRGDAHPNERANELFAEAIHRAFYGSFRP